MLLLIKIRLTFKQGIFINEGKGIANSWQKEKVVIYYLFSSAFLHTKVINIDIPILYYQDINIILKSGNHGKIKQVYQSGKVMEFRKSGILFSMLKLFKKIDKVQVENYFQLVRPVLHLSYDINWMYPNIKFYHE